MADHFTEDAVSEISGWMCVSWGAVAGMPMSGVNVTGMDVLGEFVPRVFVSRVGMHGPKHAAFDHIGEVFHRVQGMVDRCGQGAHQTNLVVGDGAWPVGGAVDLICHVADEAVELGEMPLKAAGITEVVDVVGHAMDEIRPATDRVGVADQEPILRGVAEVDLEFATESLGEKLHPVGLAHELVGNRVGLGGRAGESDREGSGGGK